MTVGTDPPRQGSLFGGFRSEAQVAGRELGITDLAASLVERGWLPRDHTACLYVSACSDTRPLTYLGPDALDRIDPRLGKAPDLFVYLDKEHPKRDPSPFGFRSDGHSAVEMVGEKEYTELFDCRTELQLVRVESLEFGDRLATVLRIEIENERFAEAAFAEEWKADWFVGVCDGCAFGGNSRCENQIWDPSNSIPLRLGARYWVTDHFEPERGWSLGGDLSLWDGSEAAPPLNERLRRRHSWRRWPRSDGQPSGRWRQYDNWVHLFEVLNPDGAAAT